MAGLYGGSDNQFELNDTYRVHHAFVNTRRYEFQPVYAGTSVSYAAVNQRERDVCLGYDANCATFTANVTLPNSTIPFITIRDFDTGGVELASAQVTTPAGTPQGSIRLTGLDYYLHETSGEIPEWFLKNNWHQLVYIVYSEGDIPGAAAACTPGVNCLTLEQTDGVDTLSNDAIRSMVFIAGEEVRTIRDAVCNVVAETAQDRATGNMNEYFELKNCDDTDALPNDDEFQRANLSTTFNDQVRIVN